MMKENTSPGVSLAQHSPRSIPLGQRLITFARSIYWLFNPRRVMSVECYPTDDLMTTFRAALARLAERQTPAEFGDYLEFGVFNGRSMACAYEALTEAGLTAPRLIGFDSFVGMPPESATEDRGVFIPGSFQCDEWIVRQYLREHGVDLGRVELVPGWFDESLTPATAERLRLQRTSLVMLDCALYSSTATAIRFVEPFMGPNTVVILTSWSYSDLDANNAGQKKAFEEFMARRPELRAENLPAYVHHRAFLLTRKS